tara:strand:- start:1450 stop:1821 length:372 start_codon:yes stop_codon:yes gene_type:complete
MKQIYCVKLAYSTKFYFKNHTDAIKLLGLVNIASYVEGMDDNREASIAHCDEDIPAWEGTENHIKEYHRSNIREWREVKRLVPGDTYEKYQEWNALGYEIQRDTYGYSFRDFYDGIEKESAVQ